MNLTRSRLTFGLVLGGLLAGSALGQGDVETIQRILEEGKERNRVMEHLTYLTQEIGPRLTGSTRLLQANAWTRDQFAAFGLTNVHQFRWGDLPIGFDRGPCSARMVSPVERDFELTARSWSAGTNGLVRGIVLKEPKTMEDFEAVRDSLEGAWVLRKGLPSRGRGRGRRNRGGVVPEGTEPPNQQELRDGMREAGIAGYIISARSELVRTGRDRGWRDITPDNLPNEVSIFVRRSDYDAINSRIADGETVEVEVDLQHHFIEGPVPVYNTIAEITGTELPHEVVIFSAHLDSWDGPGSQGAQDNGTGSMVMLEAARILAAADAKPKRTIRFVMWTGEEQGLLGSRAYADSLSQEELDNISAVFVDDGGTNYQGGVSCIESMAPMLREATAPLADAFPDMPLEIRVIENMPRGGPSDHGAFLGKGVPGFFWMETGRGDYGYSWHTQNDKLEYVIPEYLVQSSTCSAVTAYNLACAETLLPRQPKAESADEAEERSRPGGDAGETSAAQADGAAKAEADEKTDVKADDGAEKKEAESGKDGDGAKADGSGS